MAYNRKFWQDHVTEYENRYKETTNSDGTITHEPVEGEVIQQGTPQNSNNFNNIETGIFSNNEMGAELTRTVLHHSQAIKQLDGEVGEVSLINSLDYPFNNSIKTVAFAVPKNTLDYSIDVEIKSSNGDIGHIKITDKQKNGFKISYTGGATAATLKYIAKGGLL